MVATKVTVDEASPSVTKAGSADAPYTRQQWIILIVILISQFLSSTSLSIPAPFLPRMDERHGVNSVITGWILGLSSFIQLALSPLVGKLVPHTGLHTMTVFGLFFVGGATMLFGVLEYIPARENTELQYLTIAFTIRTAHALGSTAFSPSARTILSVTFPKNTTTVMSYAETMMGVGILVGPGLGSTFFKMGGFMATFAADGGLLILCSGLMHFLLPFNIGSEGSDNYKPVSVRKLLSDVKVIYGLILVAYSAAMWSCIDPVLEPELRRKYQLSQELSALSFLLLSATYVVSAPAVGKCLDNLKCLDSVSVMMSGYILMALNFILMGPSPLTPWLHRPLWLLLTCVGVLGIGLGLTIVPSLALLYNSSSSDGRKEDTESQVTSTNAMLSSFWSSAYALGDWAGPVISGAVVKRTNFGWTMTVYALSSVAVIIIIVASKLHELYKCCSANKLGLTSKGNGGVKGDELIPLINNS